MKDDYGRQGIKPRYNKTVELAKLLCNKLMVVKEGKEYKLNRYIHYSAIMPLNPGMIFSVTHHVKLG